MPDTLDNETHDPLTGLYNRRYALRTLGDMLEATGDESPSANIGIVLAGSG